MKNLMRGLVMAAGCSFLAFSAASANTTGTITTRDNQNEITKYVIQKVGSSHADHKSSNTAIRSKYEKWPMLPKNYTFRENFLPFNNIKIPVNSQRRSEVTKEVFITILTKVWDSFAPDFAMRGLLFQPAMNWEDDTFNAFAYQQNGTAYVVMLGGLARFSEMTADGFAFIACHEIGHHLGGLPTYPEGASTEGASDYFAAVKCLRRIFALGETWGVASPFSPFKAKLMDPYALQLCDSVYALPADRRICYRITAAAQSVANAFYAIDRASGIPVRVPRFQTPSQDVARFALAHHPPTQCRLDTGLQGALCASPLTESFTFGNVLKGGCHPAAQKYRVGFRPRCWYSDQAPPQEYWDWLTKQALEKQQQQQIRIRARVNS